MLCEKTKCTGCFACYNICPKNAIMMEEDEFGNIYPKINFDKCINCNLCSKVCPELNENLNFSEASTAFLLYDKNLNERVKSTSGGAAMLFSKQIIKNGGVVYGASNVFGNARAGFDRIDNLNDLYKIRGSKYFHCYINDSLKKIKKDLIDGKNVLFIGTPCQVAGLKMFLMREYDNLITVEIICHGVPSQKIFFDNLNLPYNEVFYVKFRNEKGFCLNVFDANNKILLDRDAYQDYFYFNFLHGNFYRDNCYSCKYAKRERVSDITIGDFWGVDKKSHAYDSEKFGHSLVLPISEKGMSMLKNILNDCVYDERPLIEAYGGNAQLNHPTFKTKEFYNYKKYYPKTSFRKCMIKTIGLKEYMKISLRKSKLFKILKKIKF